MNNSTTTSNEPLVESVVTKSSPATTVLVFAIRGYRRLHAGRIAPCRFYPSCSHYAEEAIVTHGAAKGTLLALRRLSRCRPFGPHGIDLVPEAKKTRSSH